MSFWNGALSPMIKHRDYQHSNFPEHARANGAIYSTQRRDYVMVDASPIDTSALSPSQKFYAVDWDLRAEGRWYRFLIPALAAAVISEPDDDEPDWESIKEYMGQYFASPVSGGRDWLDYIDEEETPKENLVRLIESERNAPPSRTRSVDAMLASENS